MKVEIHYNEAERKANDERAIRDIEDYCMSMSKGPGNTLYESLLKETGKVVTADDFQQINIAMGFCGIEGYPVHAWGRKHCLEAYRAWMMQDNIETDEAGFKIKAAG